MLETGSMTRKLAAYGLLGVITVTSAGAVGRTAWQERQFANELRLLAAQGYPVDNVDLEERYRADTSSEATEDWLRALEPFSSERFQQEGLPVSYIGIPSAGGGDPVPEHRDDWERRDVDLAFVQRWQGAIDAIRSRSKLIETHWTLLGSWPSAGRLTLQYYDLMLRVPTSPTLDFMKSTAYRDWEFSQEFQQRRWLAKRDTVIALQATVALHKFAQYLVEQESLARLAQLAWLLRSFESRTGWLPSDLTELRILEVDLNQFQSYLQIPFHYHRDDSGEAVLWGPDPAHWPRYEESHEDSAEVPPSFPSGVGIEDDNKWIWRLAPVSH